MTNRQAASSAQELQDFLDEFVVQDLAAAKKAWEADRAEVAATRSLRDVIAMLTRESRSLRKALDKCNNELGITVLGHIIVQDTFREVNLAIGNLIHHPEIQTLFLSTPSLRQWNARATYPNYAIPSFRLDRAQPHEKQLHLRLAIWKFLDKRLLQWWKPFECFGERGSRVNYVYYKLFPDANKSKLAQRWRSWTAGRLLEMDHENAAVEQNILDNLIAFLSHKLSPGTIDPQEARRVLTLPDINESARELVSSALALARLLVRDQAIYTLDVPRITNGTLYCVGNTAKVGSTVGVAIKTENRPPNKLTGKWEIKLVGSPALWRWGSGRSDRLDEAECIVPAYVELL